MKLKNILPALLGLVLLYSCEDAVTIDLDEGTEQVAVDAFINNLDTVQKITLKKSKSFFDKNDQENVVGATVIVKDDQGSTYNFTDMGNGNYEWDDTVLVHENRAYTLSIAYNGVTYTSTSFASPVPTIDSIQVYNDAENVLGFGKGYLIEMHATERPGQIDYYWIKTFKNGVFDNRTDAINYAIDATPGGGGDGTSFIIPNRLINLNNPDDMFDLGDTARVELWSMEKDGVTFLQEIQGQTSNQGLFATPPSNVRTNIVSSSTAVENKAIGFFTASMVSALEVTIK